MESSKLSLNVVGISPDKIVTLSGLIEGDECKVAQHSKMTNPEGFKNGFVMNLEKASSSLVEMLKTFIEKEGAPLYVALDNPQLRAYSYSSSQYYQGDHRTISVSEVQSVIQQTRSVATLPLTDIILQTVPESFMVNDLVGITNPIGLEARRLGVTLNLFTMNFQEYKNLSNAFETAEIEVAGYFPKTMTLPEASLTGEEKQQGVLILDIHEEHTQFILYKAGTPSVSKTNDLAGSWLTKRIAQEWRIESYDAVRAKNQYGSLNPTPEFSEELVHLIERQGIKKNQIRRSEFQETFIPIIYDWLTSLWGLADKFAEENDIKFPHYVFTGPGASIDGLIEFIHRRFSRVARVGLTRKVDAPHELLVDPSMTASLGLIKWICNHEKEQGYLTVPTNFIQRTLSSAKDWFFNYF